MPNSEALPVPSSPARPMRVIVVTGLAGSGRRTAMHVLEDLGFYCIDNLPVTLIPPFLELCEKSAEPISRVALGIDLRERVSLGEYPSVLKELRSRGQRLEVFYFEAADEVLLRRFSETRRPHPLAGGGGVEHGIRTERERLTWLRELADQVIDTSAWTVHELRDQLRQLLSTASPQASLIVTVESFGFKYGVPTDADVMFDVRFLPNPFFVEQLRAHTGMEPAVADFVLQREEARQFLAAARRLLEITLPLYLREGKSYLTLAIGCTGGRHRSVAIAEEMGTQVKGWGYEVQLRHRDVHR